LAADREEGGVAARRGRLSVEQIVAVLMHVELDSYSPRLAFGSTSPPHSSYNVPGSL